jgi:hypothetical protein
MTKVVYEPAREFSQIRDGLLEGEHAGYDAIGAGTGFIGLTDRRVII